MSIKQKLALSSLAVLLIVFFLVGFAYMEARSARSMAQRIKDHVVPNLRALEEMRFGIVRVVSSTSEYLLLELAGRDGESGSSGGELAREGEKALIREGIEAFEGGLAIYGEGGHSGDQQDLITPIVSAFGLVRELAERMIGTGAAAPPSRIFRLKEEFERRERQALEAVNAALERELGETGWILGETCSTISGMSLIATLIAAVAAFVLALYTAGVFRMAMREADARGRAEATNASLVREVEFRKKVETQLAATQKLKAMGTLLGGMAHSVNNYLVPIISLTRMTREELPAGSTAADDLGRVLDAAESAGGLLQEVLAFSRPKREVPTGHGETELSRCLGHAVEIARAALPSRIVLCYRPGANGAIVPLGCEEIETLLLNLTSNAVDAIGERPGEIGIEVRRVDIGAPPPDEVPPTLSSGRYACISVTDSGSGIAADIMPHLFDPFFTTKEVGKGAGLGLWVTFGIADRAGGGVSVESSPGEGARFQVFIPVDKGAREQPEDRGGE